MNSPLQVEVVPVPLDAIVGLREQYRREMNCQIVHDSWHARGFTNTFLLHIGGETAGYGSVGGAPQDAKDTLKEFFVLPKFRGVALPLFHQLVVASGARTVEAQTNDTLLLLMLFDCAVELTSDTVLFADGLTTRLAMPDVKLRRVTDADHETVFRHSVEPVGEWGLECNQELAATGGFFCHYNPPYADIYMEVAPGYRRHGFGSFLVQELKRLCYEAGHVPAARCGQSNICSRHTLQRAGMFPCARIVRGSLISVHDTA